MLLGREGFVPAPGDQLGVTASQPVGEAVVDAREQFGLRRAEPGRPAPRSELEHLGDELIELRRAELLDRLEQRIARDLGLEVDRGHVVNPENRTSRSRNRRRPHSTRRGPETSSPRSRFRSPGMPRVPPLPVAPTRPGTGPAKGRGHVPVWIARPPAGPCPGNRSVLEYNGGESWYDAIRSSGRSGVPGDPLRWPRAGPGRPTAGRGGPTDAVGRDAVTSSRNVGETRSHTRPAPEGCTASRPRWGSVFGRSSCGEVAIPHQETLHLVYRRSEPW
jgi:hypothetical protein